MQVDLTYQEIKVLILAKGLNWQYTENTSRYNIFFGESGIFYAAIVWKSGFESLDVNVSQNTADRTDFENNYKSTANTSAGTGTAGTAASNVLTIQGINGMTAIKTEGSITDNNAFTDGTTKLMMNGFVLDDVAGTTLTENDAAAARIDTKRSQICVIEDSSTRGRIATVTASNALKVDGSAVTQPISGTVSGTGTFTTADNQTITDNAGFTDGTNKVMISGHIFDEVAGTALTENDAAASRIDAKRAQVFVIEDTTTRGQRTTVTASNALKVDGSAVTQPISGTVTANIGTSGSLALDASVSGLSLSQASTTSGQKGTLNMGAVTTSAPSYTTAQTNPLSLTTTGNLRVDGSSVTQPISGTVTANAGTGNFNILGTGTAGTAASGVVTVQGIASMTAVKVDGSAVTQPISGTITANAGTGTFTTADNQTIVDNAGFTDGTSKVLTAGFIFDEVAGTALTENDAAAARVDAKRSQVFVIEDTTTRGQRATVTASNALKVDGSAVTQPISGTVTANAGTGNFNILGTGTAGSAATGVVTIQGIASMTAIKVDGSAVTQPISGTVTTNAGTGTFASAGDVASGSSDSGNPIKIGAKARTANPTAVTDAQRVNLGADKLGRLIVVPTQARDLISQGTTTITSTTETTILAAGGANVFLDATYMSLTNTSASATRVDIRDATAGTIRYSVHLPATSNTQMPFNVPFKQTTANNNWTAQLGTAVTDVRIMIQAAQNL